MRKIILGIVCLFLSFYASAQTTYTSGHLTMTVRDSIFHDSTACRYGGFTFFTITLDSSYMGETVRIIDTLTSTLLDSFINTSGISPWIVSTPILEGASSDLWDFFLSGGHGYYYSRTVKSTAGNDTTTSIGHWDTITVANSCIYNTVTGAVFADNNGNCIFDSGDVGLHLNIGMNENFSTPPGVGYWPYGWQDSVFEGSYTIWAQQSWMTNYTVSIPAYYAFIFPASPCFITIDSFITLPQTNINFPLQCTSNVDVQCYAGSPGNVRRYRPFYMQPYVSNTGCDSASGQLTFIKDSRVSYDSAMSTNPAIIVSGDTLIWNYSGLTSLAAGAYWNSFLSNIYLIPDSTLAVGDTLCFRVYTNVPTADINPANNDYTICLPVVYSYDPNEKDVSPKGTGPEGFIAASDTLTYTLHFQNTGSAEADNIIVIDTLDSHINPHSLKVLGTSNNMTPQWLASNVVAFNFNDIFLPDSTDDEPGSHGFVRFSVVLDSGLAPGSQIKNTGYIYFDVNPAVVTNTTLNTIPGPTNVQQVVSNGDVTLYPNPANDMINLAISKGTFTELTIFNNVGASVLQRSLSGTTASVNVAILPAGMYYVHVRSDNNMRVLKFVKE